jgi:predicted cupin superfamily sugar epimerase
MPPVAVADNGSMSAPDRAAELIAQLGLLPHVVPAGWWQAARPTGQYSLVGCTVGPGFQFDDFTMLSDVPAATRPLIHPASVAALLL